MDLFRYIKSIDNYSDTAVVFVFIIFHEYVVCFRQMFVFVFISVIMGIIFFQLDLTRNGLQSRSVFNVVIEFA